MKKAFLRAGIFLVVAVSLVAGAVSQISPTEAAGGPTVYSEFNSGEVKGVVRVERFMSGAGSHVTAKFSRPVNGELWFCDFFEGGYNCQTVRVDLSTFSKNDCVEFDINFSITVTSAAVFPKDSVQPIDSATLSEVVPHGAVKLNSC